MSASEKLKALSFQPVVYADGDFQFRDGYSKDSLLPLLNALPEIVAVVGAAEMQSHYMSAVTWEGQNEKKAVDLAEALAALEEKLAEDKP